MCIRGIPEGEETKGQKEHSKKYWQIFPILIKDTNLHIQRAQQIPKKIHVKNFTTKHIVVNVKRQRQRSY